MALDNISFGDMTPNPTILHIKRVSLKSTLMRLSTDSFSSASKTQALHTMQLSLFAGVHHLLLKSSISSIPLKTPFGQLFTHARL